MIQFEKYAKIKDNYCICYFGPSDEYLLQLKLLKPSIERQFPGIKVFFGCRDDKVGIFEGHNVLKVSELKMKRYDFGHINELRYDGKNHPVEQFIKNSDLTNWCVSVKKPTLTRKCVIVTKGNYPTQGLSLNEITMLKKMGTESGYNVEVDTDVTSCGLVMGVESYCLFEAAANGIKTKLVPRGIGTNLYIGMFPDGEVLTV